MTAPDCHNKAFMKNTVWFVFILAITWTRMSYAQVISNKNFSMGTYGRAGIGFGAGIQDQFPRSLNLNGMGSIGGRFEENDYLELAAAMHFTPVSGKKDTTDINIQTRLAFYTTQGQIIGNVTSKSYGGITVAMPELYAEAKHIRGSDWSVWIGAKLQRTDDIHIIDHFYFDDHSSQGIGVKYKNTQISVMLPGSVDTNSTLPPYFYLNIVNGTPVLGLRNRVVSILEHNFPLKSGYLKLMGEFHRLGNATNTDTVAQFNYPSDIGFVAGAKIYTVLPTALNGSFNAFSVRYGNGIANGGDGGASKTFLTYGGPNLSNNKFDKAWSLALTETILWNISKHYSLNGYGIYTKSRGASDSLNKTPDYLGKQMLFNRKTDFAFGARGTWYLKDWLHLLHELDFAWRKDGTQETAQMTKFSIAPTLVPDGKRDVWSRPHFRLVYSVAYYNKFASDNLYSPYLAQTGSKRWGQYIGIKAEWWIW
jgi:maltoporin